MKCQRIGAHPEPIAIIPRIRYQDMPAINKMVAPEAATRIAVPKSGSLAINTVGIASSNIVIAICFKRGGNGCAARYQAAIIGIAIFIISDG